MRKNIIKVWDLPSNGGTSALIIISVVFFVGCIAGCIFAGWANSEDAAALSYYLDGFVNVVLSGETSKPAFVFLLWKAVRWPLFALFLGLTPIGLICIPVLVLIRSFILSFSVASFFEVLGIKGLIFAFSVLGISGLIYVPILFLFGIGGFLNSASIAGRFAGEGRQSLGTKQSNFLFCCICFIIIIICCLIEYSVGTVILKSTAEMLFSV